MARKVNPKSLPYFPLYAAAWKYSETVANMTMAERGIYVSLMVENWLGGEIPWDGRSVARLLNIHRTVAERFLKKYSNLAEEVRKGCGRYYLPKLLEFALTLGKTSRTAPIDEMRVDDIEEITQITTDGELVGGSEPDSPSPSTGEETRPADRVAACEKKPDTAPAPPRKFDTQLKQWKDTPAPVAKAKTKVAPVAKEAKPTLVLNDIREWSEERFNIPGERLRNCLRFVLDTDEKGRHFYSSDYYRKDPITAASMDREKFVRSLDKITPPGWTPESTKKAAPVRVETPEEKKRREYSEAVVATKAWSCPKCNRNGFECRCPNNPFLVGDDDE